MFSSLVRLGTSITEPRKADGGAADESGGLRRPECAGCLFFLEGELIYWRVESASGDQGSLV